MKHEPHEMLNGITTRSPGAICVTSEPTSSTMPMGSWPRTSPSSRKGLISSYRWRSEPQMAVEVMRMIASVGSSILGSGTDSTLTSRLPCHVTAFMQSRVPGPRRSETSEVTRLVPEIDVDPFAGEQLRAGLPGEEDDDLELDALARRRVVEPVVGVGAGDVGLLAHPLRADHDVRQLEVDVREAAEQPRVEARGPLMAPPDVLGADDLVDAVLRERGQEPRDVALVLGLRVALPELADRGVLLGVDRAAQQVADVPHARIGSQPWQAGSPTTASPPRGSPRALRSSRSSSRRCGATAR